MDKLVIYFSHIGENWYENGLRVLEVGNAEIIAKKISNLIGGDIFRVEEVEEYPNGYSDCCNVAKKELEDGIFPSIKNSLNDINEYETIYIVSPIWHDHLPMCLASQLSMLNFEGKTIKVVVTHEGSGVGKVVDDVNKYCVGASILPAIAIRGYKANECDKELEEFI